MSSKQRMQGCGTMKVLVNIPDYQYRRISDIDMISFRARGYTYIACCALNAVKNGIEIPDNVTREEAFEKLFGMKIDTSADCGFFDCEDRECLDCSVHNKYKDGVCVEDGYKKWWKSPFKDNDNEKV